MFFEPNLRGIAQQGVDLVMGHFFAGLDVSGEARRGPSPSDPQQAVVAEMEREDLVCEEMILESFNGA